ncbi:MULTISPECIES: hypothetical protein [Paenibacillus]|uniref:hypothetical protein n=1 Tax=Paenibacillus TaxID=44249 RepID=UPI00201D3C0D|nr:MULTISPECIES: hypothetical protein [Paenibacillus]
MPFVLKHSQTSQLFTCTLVNHYKLAYYGTKYWDYEEDAAAEAPEFLRAQGAADPELWELLELTDNQLKLCNVKLKNDPRLTLVWDAESQRMSVHISPS